MPKEFTRSTKVSIKFSNKNKQESLNLALTEYNRLLNSFIDFYWNQDIYNLPKYCTAKEYNQFDSILSANLKQRACNHALEILRGLVSKQKNRKYIHNKLIEEGKIKEAERLKRIIDENNFSKPVFHDIIPMPLSERNFKIDMDNKTSFDGWIKLYLGFRTFSIPFKKTEHFNKMLSLYKMSQACRIDKDSITFFFKGKMELKTDGETLGIDIGSSTIISCSDGFASTKLDGYDLSDIQKKMSRKKKGSKAFKRCQIQRKNYINWTINQLNLDGIKTVKRENIKNLGKYEHKPRFLQSWTYAEIFDKLDRYCQEQNVSVVMVPSFYTSQRCSACGWTRKSNRKGKQFKCSKCGFTADADLNAACNISLNLPAIGKKKRLSQDNRSGFYWTETGQEPLVPVVQKSIEN
jgi:transposase